MNLKENIFEGLRSIKSNMLRTVLTAAIITFGIMALVGILTAIDGMQGSVKKSFDGMGVNSFDIRIEQNSGFRIKGRAKKKQKPISNREAQKYKEILMKKTDATVSIYTFASSNEVAKYNTIKTNPNVTVVGADMQYLGLKGYKIQTGRNLSPSDAKYYNKVALIGSETASKLFPSESPLGKDVIALGDKFTIIGVLEKKGGMSGGNDDRVIVMPLEVARLFDQQGTFSFEITSAVENPNEIESKLSEATNTMRLVRGDLPAEDDSFKIERSDALLKDLDDITGYLKIGGFGISIITLLGASIALMNIMMVSVTERTREIGIRKALGASPRKIRIQFLLEAIVICLIGGILGIVLGIAMGNVVSSLIMNGADFIIPWNWIILGFSVCVIVGLLSGYYPAYRASKLDPIESLRYE
jgi:putative ABC transport system permease protein